MNCTNCGTYMQDNEPYCPMCGTANPLAAGGQPGYPGQVMPGANTAAVKQGSKKPVIIIAAAVAIIGIVVAILFIFVFNKSGGYVGKWEVQEMSAGGVTMKDTFFGIPVAIMFQAEFNEDGTGTVSQNRSGTDEQKLTFKWEEKDGGVVMKKDGINEELKFTKDGDYLVCDFTEDGESTYMKLKKVDSFTTFDFSSITSLFG